MLKIEYSTYEAATFTKMKHLQWKSIVYIMGAEKREDTEKLITYDKNENVFNTC